MEINKLEYPNLYRIQKQKEQNKTIEEYNKNYFLYIDSFEDLRASGFYCGNREFKTVELSTVAVLKVLAFRNPNITIKEA